MFMFAFTLVVFFSGWLSPGKIFAVERSGCSGFSSSLTNLALDSCTGTLCFTAQLDAQGMHGTCNWQVDYGDGSTSNTTTGGSGSVSITLNLCHTYATSGTFVLTMSITPAHTTCIDQYTITIPIHGASFTGNNVCFNNTTTFIATSVIPVNAWDWDFGDGTTSTLQNPTHTYPAPGTYNVTLIATTTCKDTMHQVVIVNPIPVANFSLVNTCFGSPICFTNLSTVLTDSIASWNWDFGDPTSGPANTSNQQNPCHTFTSAQDFSVTLIVVSDSGCPGIPVILTAAPNPIPVAAFTNTNVCLHAATDFTDASTTVSGNPINDWNWNFGDGTSNGTQQNPSHLYASADTFSVTLVVTTLQGCKDTVEHPAIVYFNPIANFSDSAKGCAPVCTNFNDLSTTLSGTINGWNWSFQGGSPSVSDQQNPATCFNTPGTYDVSLITTTNFGCKDTLLITQYVNVYEWPVADFCVTPQQASIHDPLFYFCDLWSTNVTQWYWDFGDNFPGDNVNTDPEHSYSGSATNNDFYNYEICLKVQTQYGCRDSICKTIDILPEFTFYIANTFTPNGDNINDVFYGKGIGIKEYEIMIFDRWGNLIWQCDHEGKNIDWDATTQEGMPSACKWDGKANHGKNIAQIDVYVWKVKLTDIFNKKHFYMGIVNLVK